MCKGRRWENLLKRNCRCFLAYYEERSIELGFKDLDYITSRILTNYSIYGDKEILNIEIENFENIFNREYVKRKINELTINDASLKNLVKEAVI